MLFYSFLLVAVLFFFKADVTYREEQCHFIIINVISVVIIIIITLKCTRCSLSFLNGGL